MSFEHPQALLLLLVLIPLGGVFFAELLHARKALDILSSYGAGEVLRQTLLFRWLVSLILFVLFFICLTLALAGLTWGQRPVEEDRTGIDVVFAVDVSRSMALGLPGNTRLDQAREVLRRLSQELPEARVGLTAFKGEASSLVPLTHDHRALDIALASLDPSLGTAKGTKLEAGLETALTSFVKGSNHHRVIVLLGDGGGINAKSLAQGRALGDEGILLVVVALGRPGEKIGNLAGPDPDGQGLTELARLARGIFVKVDSPELAVSGILSDLGKRLSQSEKNGFRLVGLNRAPFFILLALLFLGAFVWFRSVRGMVKL